jgi:hypothetical protein
MLQDHIGDHMVRSQPTSSRITPVLLTTPKAKAKPNKPLPKAKPNKVPSPPSEPPTADQRQQQQPNKVPSPPSEPPTADHYQNYIEEVRFAAEIRLNIQVARDRKKYFDLATRIPNTGN